MKRPARALPTLLYLYLSLMIGFLFVVFPGIDGNPIAGFADMVYGRASRPFVYRTLLPSVIRYTSALVPEQARWRMIRAAQGDSILSVAVPLLRWERRFLPEYAIAWALVCGCFLGYAFLLRNLARRFHPSPARVANAIPAVGLLIVPAFFRYINHIYDPGTLLTYTAAMVCIVSGRVGWFSVGLALASINKETAILLAGLFLLFHVRTMPKRRLALHLAGHVALWASLKAIIMFVYRGNAGSVLEFHLIDRTLAYGRHLDRLLGFIAFSGVWVLLTMPGWKRSPRFLRAGLVATLAPLLGSALFFGFLDETRGYYEALPFLTLLLAPALADAFDAADQGRTTCLL